MNRSGPISNRSTTSVKFPAWEMMSLLINQVPGEAFILDSRRGRILLANQGFYKLSGISGMEIGSKSLVDILSGLEWISPTIHDQIIELSQGETHFYRKVKMYSVEMDNEFHLVLLEPDLTLESEKKIDGLIKGYSKLVKLMGGDNLDESFQIALDALQHLTGAGLVAIYRAEGDFPRFSLVKSLPMETNFPNQVAAVQNLMQGGLRLWMAGNRTNNELQRFAVRIGCRYLAIHQIGEAGKGLGLLVVADCENEPSVTLDDSMGLVSTALGYSLQSQMLLSSLKKKISQTENQLLFRQNMFQNAPEGVFFLDQNLNILECNPACEWLLGYSSAEVYQKPIDNILIGSDSLLANFESARKGIATHNSGVLHLNRRSGDSLSAQVQILPILEGEDVEGVLVFINDVSENEQIRARTQQLESRALIGEFTAIFAHEVGNPINNIYAALQNMEVLMPDNDPNAQRVQSCLAECNRLKSLMTSVLDFSRPLEPQLDMVDIVMLLRRLMERWRPKMANLNIEPLLQVIGEIPLVKADPRLLDQVFTNLISNAISIMSENEKGVLAIRIQMDTEVPNLSQVEISVTDDGPGIPEELLSHIFEPFVSKRKGGTGLGLAIVKRIITSHHGTITAQSFTPGTIFTIKIPITPNGG